MQVSLQGEGGGSSAVVRGESWLQLAWCRVYSCNQTGSCKTTIAWAAAPLSTKVSDQREPAAGGGATWVGGGWVVAQELSWFLLEPPKINREATTQPWTLFPVNILMDNIMSNRTCLKRKMPVNKLKTSSACYVAELIFSGSQSGVTRKVMKYESEAKKIKEIAVTACVCASARVWGVLSKGLKEEREEKKVIDALGKGRRRSGLQLNCCGCNASQLSSGRAGRPTHFKHPLDPQVPYSLRACEKGPIWRRLCVWYSFSILKYVSVTSHSSSFSLQNQRVAEQSACNYMMNTQARQNASVLLD